MTMLKNTFFGLLIIVLAVVSSNGAFFNESDANSTNTTSDFTNITTALFTSLTTLNITTAAPTTKPITTAQVTTLHTTVNDSTDFTKQTTFTTANSTSTTTKSSPTTIVTPGRKFDSLSFVGGMILAAGLGAILFLVVSYVRRNNQLPYANLR